MKHLLLLFTLFILCQSTTLTACSCANILSFCEGINSDANVMEVEVLEKYGTPPYETFMDINVLVSLQGNISYDQLTIRNYGTTCDVNFDRFDIGEKLVVTFSELEMIDTLSHYPYFHFGACQNNFLTIEGDKIIGNIEPEISTKNYDDFKNNIGTCSDLTLFDRDPEKLDKFIHIFPNPTYDFLNVNFSILNPAEISLELFNATGQKITSINSNLQHNYRTDITSLAHGLYFLRITYRKISIVKRIVKI